VSIEPGQSWSKQLSAWLLGRDIALAIVSYAAGKSDWCRREWGVLAARQQHTGLLVIPVYLDDEILSNGYWDATLDFNATSRANALNGRPNQRIAVTSLRARTESTVLRILRCSGARLMHDLAVMHERAGLLSRYLVQRQPAWN
jgi:hypothetical protein